MNDRHDPTPVVRAWLREVPGLADRDALARRVRDLVHETPQTPSSSLGRIARRVPAPRSRRRSSILSLVAAAAILAAVAGALLLAAAVAPPSIRTPSPRPTTTVTHRIAGDGPLLTWEPVPLDFELVSPAGSQVLMWSGGRFIMRDAKPGLHESRDGLSWTSLAPVDAATEDVMDNMGVVVWLGERRVAYHYDSAILQIDEPGGTVTTHVFRGPIEGIASAEGVGGAGIVVVESLTREDVIGDLLGPAIVAQGWVVSRVSYPTWQVESGGRSYTIDLAANGYGRRGSEDIHAATLGWLSRDGIEWRPIHQQPVGNWRGVVGSDIGFFGIDDDPDALWYSGDGLAWTQVGETTAWDLIPWPGVGVVVRESTGLRVAKPDGLYELRLPADVVDAGGTFDDPSYQAEDPGPIGRHPTMGAGLLGLLRVDGRTGLSVFSRDGMHWGLARVPDSWSQPFTVRSLVFGDDTALMAVSRCVDPGPNPGDGTRCFERGAISGELWRGTLEPVFDPSHP